METGSLAPGSDPLEFISGHHRSVLEHCDALQSWAVAPGSADARALHRFFDTLIRLHLADEEQDLFPRLVRVSLKLAEQVHALREDHRNLRERWARLGPLLARPESIDDTAEVQRLAEEFAALKRGHVAREESLLQNQARHLLSRQELAGMTTAMLERRGVRG